MTHHRICPRDSDNQAWRLKDAIVMIIQQFPYCEEPKLHLRTGSYKLGGTLIQDADYPLSHGRWESSNSPDSMRIPLNDTEVPL